MPLSTSNRHAHQRHSKQIPRCQLLPEALEKPQHTIDAIKARTCLCSLICADNPREASHNTHAHVNTHRAVYAFETNSTFYHRISIGSRSYCSLFAGGVRCLLFRRRSFSFCHFVCVHCVAFNMCLYVHIHHISFGSCSNCISLECARVLCVRSPRVLCRCYRNSTFNILIQ